MSLQKTNIDAVILWVDGSDPEHQEKILPYIENKDSFNTQKFQNRFYQVDEIKFSVDSILKFAPYIRNIFIVSDNQCPSFLTEDNNKYSNVSVIDHKVIFKGYEEYLPIFNSRAIETCIHRIPNLSEHFIYLNDDFFLINPTEKKDFFTKNGHPILRGFWQKMTHKNSGHKAAQEKGASLAGFDKLYRFKHTPHPVRKSTLASFFDENPEVFINNIKYRFRSSEQFLPIALTNHLEIKNETFKQQKNLQLLYFRSYKKPLIWYKFKFNFQSKNKLFLGLQSLNNCTNNKLEFILEWLNNRVS